MDKWQQLIRSAKQASHYKAYDQTIRKSLEALAEAKTQFPKQLKINPAQATAAVAISYSTLNEGYIEHGDYLSAQKSFIEAIDFFAKAHQFFAKTAAQQTAVIHSAQQIQFEWGNFTRDYAAQFIELHLDPKLTIPQCLHA